MEIKKILIGAFVTFALMSCEEEKQPALFKQTQVFDIDNGVINTNTYIEAADAHSGKKYSRADVGTNFGFGYSFTLADSLLGREVALDIDVWVRTGDLSNACEFIVSTNSRDSLLLWQPSGVKAALKAPNEWTNVVTTVNLPASMTAKPNFKVTLLAHNVDAKSYFDIDDLKLTVYEKGQ